MQIWVVPLRLSTDVPPDELFQRCLLLVDEDSRLRIQRFHRRQDAWRCLVGRLLPRALLRMYQIPTESAVFGRTEAGKPYVETSNIHPAIGFNITHDNNIVAMVSRLGDKPTVDKIGIDIMKRTLPKGETVRSFLNAIADTLTQSELAFFTPEMDTLNALRHIFMLWTLKEAYTKALGFGLGFDFKRINYDIPRNSVTVDNDPTTGWEFLSFTVQAADSEDLYQGTVASCTGEKHAKMEFIRNIEEDPRFSLIELSQLIETQN